MSSPNSVILVNFSGEEKEVTIVWGYNIKSVTPLEATPQPGLAEAVDAIFRKETVILTLTATSKGVGEDYYCLP